MMGVFHGDRPMAAGEYRCARWHPTGEGSTVAASVVRGHHSRDAYTDEAVIMPVASPHGTLRTAPSDISTR